MGSIRSLILRLAIKHLLKGITSDDILTITSKGWVSEGRELTPEEKSDIKAHAKELRKSLLWHYISKELEYEAFVTGRKATNRDEVMATHYMYYNLDRIQQFLDRCSKL